MTTIIGIDCAAQPENTGLARARADAHVLIVEEARCASRRETTAAIVGAWLRGCERALLALDAPLGWPATLGDALVSHAAGGALEPTAHRLFRRATDDAIHQRLKRRPLDIGADRIARAAHAALRLLADLRSVLDTPIELAWSSRWRGSVAAIEVYPAGTRAAFAVASGKGSLKGLEHRLRLDASLPDSEHVRDAIVCALTGLEFLQDRCVAPTDEERAMAEKEGWIWTPTPRAPVTRARR